jgi:ribonuclease J
MSETKKLTSPVQIYALGGLGEVGKNIYCIENDNSILIVDCGVLFPDDSMPGID